MTCDCGVYCQDHGRESGCRYMSNPLREALEAFSKAVSMPGGPSLAIQRHAPSWEAWKKLCEADAALDSETVEADGGEFMSASEIAKHDAPTIGGGQPIEAAPGGKV